jgi:hypothetical protein
MAEASVAKSKPLPAWVQWVLRHKTWMLLGMTILLVVFVRVRLRDMPLERDEGEYAYAGQLILQGVPPYKEVYNMKLPGTYLAYSAIMAVLGQTCSGIHLGLLVVNVASILLLFFIGRRLLDETAGIVAAAVYALTSLSPSVLGLAGHATHFVVLPALGGILLLLKATDGLERARRGGGAGSDRSDGSEGGLRRPKSSAFRTPHSALFWSGFLFGLAFLAKQHGVFFGVFGGLYLAWLRFYGWWQVQEEKKREGWRFQGAAADAPRSTLHAPHFLCYAAGCVLPYLLTCLWLWRAGVFGSFWFWTVSYARQYGSLVSLDVAGEIFRGSLHLVVGPSLGFWVLAALGIGLLWLGRRAGPTLKFFLVALLVCSLGTVGVGFYFRQHYFITLLPVLALLCGVAVSQVLKVAEGPRNAVGMLALPVLILSSLAVGSAVVGNASAWFSRAPEQAVSDIYGTTLFAETLHLADYFKANTAQDARIGMLGSDPELFFYARRRSATGFIYMYPLMEEQRYALKMQKDMIAELERTRPEYMVYVDDPYSWLPREHSEPKLLDWWRNTGISDFEVVNTIKLEGRGEDLLPGLEAKSPGAGEKEVASTLVLYKRRSGK